MQSQHITSGLACHAPPELTVKELLKKFGPSFSLRSTKRGLIHRQTGTTVTVK